MAFPEAGKEILSKPSVSVAFAIELPQFPGRLLLVKKKNGLWSLPAGRPKKGETVRASLFREFQEETNLGPDVLFAQDKGPYILEVSDRMKSRVGIIIPAHYRGPDLSLDGWAVNDPDGDIVYAQFVDFFGIASIIDSGLIDRPEFNIHPIELFLVNQIHKAFDTCSDVATYDRMVGCVEKFSQTNPAIAWDPEYYIFRGGHRYNLPLLVSLPPLLAD